MDKIYYVTDSQLFLCALYAALLALAFNLWVDVVIKFIRKHSKSGKS